MPWGPIRGADRQVDDLRRALAAGRMPHAFLLVGPEGVGKRTFARRLAKGLFCERRPEAELDPCGLCPSCVQVEAGVHPDLLEVSRPEDKQDLPIKVIRQLCADLGLKPMMGTRRVAIVDDADDLNTEAANAFLKTLEEPPPGAVLALIAREAEGQLDTVVSRCRVLRFDRLSDEDLTEVLIQHSNLAPDEAARLAKLGEGSVARALGLADPSWEGFRRRTIDALAAERGFEPGALAGRLGEYVQEAGKEASSRRERAALVLGELSRFFRAVLWQTAGLEPPAPDAADRRAAAVLASRLGPDDVYILADRCLDADYQVGRNASMPMVLASLCHDLGAVINAGRN